MSEPAEISVEGIERDPPRDVRFLDARAIQRIIGVDAPLPELVRPLVENAKLGVRAATRRERDAVVLHLLRQIQTADLPTSGPQRQPAWERGWAESVAAFRASGHDPASLLPRYTHRSVPIRLEGDYAVPVEGELEITLSAILRCALFGRFFADVESVHEFGCGTGINLVYLSRMLPGVPLVGLDWAAASGELLALLAPRIESPLRFERFDFFEPSPLDLGRRAGVVTVTALEQVGDRFDAFLERLHAGRPSVVLHIEPVAEHYDESTLFGYLGAAYHRRRGYLQGFWTRLREQEAEGRLEILGAHHTGFGIQRHDPFSWIAWRPG